MSKSTCQAILLTQKAEVKQCKLPLQAGGLSLQTIQTHMKRKELPEILGTYRYKKNTLTLLGFTKGKAGSENKHELPPPLDSSLYFGDIILIASVSPNNYTKPTPFKAEEYEAFYTKSFGGFDDIDSEEDEEEELEAEVEVEVEPEAEAEAEAEEEEEEEEAEEETVEEGEEAVEVAAAPVVQRRTTKKKKVAQINPQSGTSQILHVPKEEHLKMNADADDIPMRVDSIEKIEKLIGNEVDSTDLELSIYNSSIKEAVKRHVTCHWNNDLFKHIYQTRVRHIVGNLIPTTYVQNKRLLTDLKSGKFTIESLCDADTYTISNDMWRDYIHRRQQREKRQLEGNKAMATDQFYCKQCHKRECTYYEMQTRSADEPMTIFISCLNCGKQWRQ
jgi:transcription elongation factor S-II